MQVSPESCRPGATACAPVLGKFTVICPSCSSGVPWFFRRHDQAKEWSVLNTLVASSLGSLSVARASHFLPVNKLRQGVDANTSRLSAAILCCQHHPKVQRQTAPEPAVRIKDRDNLHVVDIRSQSQGVQSFMGGSSLLDNRCHCDRTVAVLTSKNQIRGISSLRVNLSSQQVLDLANPLESRWCHVTITRAAKHIEDKSCAIGIAIASVPLSREL